MRSENKQGSKIDCTLRSNGNISNGNIQLDVFAKEIE
jgi:hypothetical protein